MSSWRYIFPTCTPPLVTWKSLANLARHLKMEGYFLFIEEQWRRRYHDQEPSPVPIHSYLTYVPVTAVFLSVKVKFLHFVEITLIHPQQSEQWAGHQLDRSCGADCADSRTGWFSLNWCSTCSLSLSLSLSLTRSLQARKGRGVSENISIICQFFY